MDQSQTQQSLLQRAKSGESLAWERLSELYRPLIAGWAKRHTTLEQDAEDLTQEILMRMVRQLPRFEHNGRAGAFRTWLRMLAVHSTSDFLSTRNHQPQGMGGSAIVSVLQELQDPDCALTKAWDCEHDSIVINRLLEQVSVEFEPKSMAAFRRQSLEGIPAGDVARELDLSVAAVYTAKSRVLLRLRQLSEGLLDWDD